jgi:hypothetical protein
MSLGMDMTVEGGDYFQFLNVLGADAVIVANKTNERMAYRIQSNVVSAIEDQTQPLLPLSPKYLAQKIRNGLDPRTLIATEKMLSHIIVWKTGRKGKQVLHVGIHPNAVYRTKTKGGKVRSIKVVDVARMLENGTVNMPPRPVWAGVIDDMLFDLKTFHTWYFKKVRKEVEKKARKKIKRRIA